MPYAPPHWRPTAVVRFITNYGTSTRVLRVETDCGEGFLKALGNPEGPHALASELVGSRLAELVGLPTLDFAIVPVTADDDLPFHGGGRAQPGPALVSRFQPGVVWGGTTESLKLVRNRDAISELVVFDTWIRNRDRYSIRPDGSIRSNPDNVYFTKEARRSKKMNLTAIDHTHCFSTTGPLTPHLNDIGQVQDEAVYGLFPEFRAILSPRVVRRSCARIRAIPQATLAAIVNSLPQDWQVEAATRNAWIEQLELRAAYIAETICARLFDQAELDV